MPIFHIVHTIGLLAPLLLPPSNSSLPLKLGPRSTPQKTASSQPTPTSKPPRLLISLFTSTSFAFSLRLANMTSPLRVLGFLVLPPHPSFDPSLAVLAVGALPLTMLLYQTHIRSQRKKGVGSSGVEAKAQVAAKAKIDWRLVTGAALFGVGWGMEGVCRKSSASLFHDFSFL